MTVREVAAYLSVSRARVYQLIRNNRIRAVRLSTRGTRVFVSSLEDYLRSKLQG
jgi:excisionase family DNA binding protein